MEGTAGEQLTARGRASSLDALPLAVNRISSIEMIIRPRPPHGGQRSNYHRSYCIDKKDESSMNYAKKEAGKFLVKICWLRVLH